MNTSLSCLRRGFLPVILIALTAFAGPLTTRVYAGDESDSSSVCSEYRPASAAKDSILLRNAIRSATTMLELVDLSTTAPYYHRQVLKHLAALRTADSALHADAKVEFKTVLRLPTKPRAESEENLAGSSAAIKLAVDSLHKLSSNLRYYNPLVNQIGVDSTRALLEPFICIYLNDLKRARAANVEKLRRYEVKYGDNSAKLNLVEAALNFYAFQYFWPFKSTGNGPSSVEAILAYSTAYLGTFNFVDKDIILNPEVASVLEVGIRYYILDPRWPNNKIPEFIKPYYVSGGIAFSGEDNKMFDWPFRGDRRYGVFIGLGSLKAAYVGRHLKSAEILVTRQFQFIPYVF